MSKFFVGLSILFIYILMVMGNIVTTTGSGLGCPDWPLCYGAVVPPLDFQTWIEWGHRLLGGASGLFILASTVLIWLHYKGVLRLLTGSALGLLGVGVIFGGIIVLIEAPLLEGPMHLAVVSFHIVIATIIFALMIITFRRLPGSDVTKEGYFYPIMFGAVSIQVFIGILVRYGQATLACGDFPTCDGESFIPSFTSDDLELAVHVIHRLVAYGIFLATLAYLIKAIKDNHDIKNAAITFILILAQASIGVGIVLTKMFLPFVVFHGAIGFALLGWLAFRSAPYLVSKPSPELEEVIA